MNGEQAVREAERRTADLKVLARALPLFGDDAVDAAGPIPRLFSASHVARETFGVAQLETSLNGGLLRYPYIGLVRDGKQVSPREFTQTRRVAFAEQSLYADAGLVVKQFHEGSTIILKSLEEWHPPVRDMINELAALTGTQVKADVFFTPPHAKALVVHRDEFHIFAVQLHGTKDWVLQGVPEGDSWRGGPAPADTLDNPENVTLTSGDVMFLEAGTAHSAKSQDTSSMHIAFEFRSFRITDRLDQVIREIAAAEGAGFVSLDTDVAARQIRSTLSRISEETAKLDTSTLAREAAQKLIADSTRHGVTFGR